MHPEIHRLIELQTVDSRLAELRNRLQILPAQLAEVEKRVAGGRQQVTGAKDDLTNNLKDRKKYEIDVDSWKEKARKYRQQSGEVKSNEAYRALQHEIEHADRETSSAEDRLIERMVAGEQFEGQVKAAELAFAEIERSAASDREKLSTEQNLLRDKAAELENERKKLAAQVPESLLLTYENVARRRHGVAVAEIRGESCGMCGMLITPHVVQELRRTESTELFQCETCTRILYVTDPAEAPEQYLEPTPGR
jgi:predicted  nucleic acid-binding Zn-ribbon protein